MDKRIASDLARAEAKVKETEDALHAAQDAHTRAEREFYARPGKRASNVLTPIERPELPTAGDVELARSVHQAALVKRTAARAAAAAADRASPAEPVCRYCGGTARGGRMVPVLDGAVYACPDCAATVGRR